MATHLGKEGLLKIGTLSVVQFRNYALQIQAAVADMSIIGDDWDRNYGTTKNWSFSAGQWWDPSNSTDPGQNALTIGATVTVNLYPMGQATSANYFSGSAIVTGLNVQADRSGGVENALTAVGNSTLSSVTV